MDHAFYVYTAYGFAFVLTIGVVIWTVVDGRMRRKELAELEAAGIGRRSSRPVKAEP